MIHTLPPILIVALTGGFVAAEQRPLIQQFDFGAYSCGSCRTDEIKETKRVVIENLRREATRRGMDFESVCVIVDSTDPAARTPFGGGDYARASASLAQATAAEAGQRGTQWMGFCVRSSEGTLIHARRTGEDEPLASSPRYAAALADELERSGSSSICVSYKEGSFGFGRTTPVEDRTEISVGGEEVQTGEAYRLLACAGYDRVIHTGEGHDTAEFRKYVTHSPAFLEPIELVLDALPYSVQVRDQEVVLGRHMGPAVNMSTHYFTMEGKERSRFFDCFLNPGRCPEDTWWKKTLQPQ